MKMSINKKIGAVFIAAAIFLQSTILGLTALANEGYTVKNTGINASFVSSLGENIINGVIPTAKDANGETVTPVSGEVSYLTDGSVFEKHIDYDKNVNGMTLTFDAGGQFVANGFLVVSSYNPGYGDYGLGEYELYVSDYSEGLFKSRNKIIHYDNAGVWKPGESADAQYFGYEAGQEIKGRYFGVKILRNNGIEDDIRARLDEFAIYGKLNEYTIETLGIDDEYIGTLGTNFLTVKPEIIDYTNKSLEPESGTVSQLTDGKLFGNPVKFTGKVTGMKISYDMETNVNCSSVLVTSAYDSERNITLGKYAIYLSSRKDTLFNKSNLLLLYDNTKGWEANEPNIGASQLISFAKEHTGRYFGIQILSGNTKNEIYLGELGLYGKDAGETGYEIENDTVTKENLPSLGYNILAGKVPHVKNARNEFVIPENEKSFSNLTDGSILEGNYIECKSKNDGITISYDLKKQVTVEKLLIVSAYLKSKDISPAEYAIYMGNSEAELFSTENRIVYYNNGGIWKSSKANSGAVQLFKFTASPSGRYLGIKFIRQTAAKDFTLRMDEIGLYGIENDLNYSIIANSPEKPDSITQSTIAAMPENFVASGDVTFVDNGSTREPEGDIKKLTDGKVFGSSDHIDYVCKTGKDISFVIDLKGRVTMEQFLYVGYYSEDFGPVDYNITEYQLYMSDYKGDLFDSKNLVADHNNSGLWENGKVNSGSGQLISFKNKPAGQYLGIKIFQANPSLRDPAGLRIRVSEIGVYGSKGAAAFTAINEGIDESYIKNMGTNILSGKPATIQNNAGKTVTPFSGTSANLTDGVVLQNHIDIQDGPDINPITISYDMTQKISVDKLLVVGAYEDYGDYNIVKYELYIGDDQNNLFNETNRVVLYDNTGVWDPKVKNSGAVQAFLFNEKPNGRYFGIKILKSALDYLIRLDELGVFGTVDAGVPVNLLSGKSTAIFSSDYENNISDITNQFTAEQILELTDGNNLTELTFDNSGKRQEFVYDLGKEMQIDSFSLTSGKKASFESYKVYAAKNEADLWKETSLVYSKNALSNTKTLSYALSSSVKGRYVRFSILNSGGNNTCSIAELSAIGLDGQQPLNGNVIYGLSSERISAYWTDLQTGTNEKFGGFPQSWFHSADLLTDGKTDVPIFIWGSEYGKKSLDIVFQLNSSTMLNRLVYSGIIGGSPYNPRKVKFYAASSVSDLFIPENEVGEIAGDNTSNGRYELNITPTVCSFLRLAIVEGCDPSVVIDTMTAAISEFEAYGFAVEPVSQCVQSFTDSSTGIKVDIFRNRNIDTFPAGEPYMKVVRINANASQSASANEQDEKIASNIYKILFYDANGKLSDLGNRAYSITIPIPESLDPDLVSLAIADGNNIKLTAGLSKNKAMSYKTAEAENGMEYLFTLPNRNRNNDILSPITGDYSKLALAASVLSLAVGAVLLFGISIRNGKKIEYWR